MYKFLFLFLLMGTTAGFAQNADSVFIRRLADEILENGQAYENLRVLCKTVGPRLAGSAGMVKAESWGMKTLKAMGADNVFLQECTVPHWERGGKDEGIITIKDNRGKTGKFVLDVLAVGNTLGTGAKGIKAPVIMIRNFDELEARKSEVKGKIVYYSGAFDPKHIIAGRAYSETGVFRRAGASRAAKYGALAVMIRSLTYSVDNHPHTGALAYDESQPKIPSVAMGARDSDSLNQLFKSGVKMDAYIRTMAHFRPDTIGHNVIGELKGTEFPNEYIVVGGHLDSWDVAEGAHDDGAGCVHAIEVLRALKAVGYQPKRTIRVVLFANEENGLRGGTKYAEAAASANEKHLFALESDNGGFAPRGFDFVIEPDRLQKMQAWVPLFLPYGVYYLGNGGGGADVGPLNQKSGVAVSAFRPDSQRYFDIHHARNDVFENVHKRELELGAVNMAALIFMVDKYGL